MNDRPNITASTPETRGMVLIGFGEALAAPESAWSLRDAGYEVCAFIRAGSKPALRCMRGMRLYPIASPEIDAKHCVSELETLISRVKPMAVFPLDDAALWISEQVRERTSVRLVGATGEQATVALDKRRQIEAAARAGLRVPATEVIEDVDRATMPTDMPVVLKPALATACRDDRLDRGQCHVCASPQEWEAMLQSSRGTEPLLCQQYVEGVGEGVFGLATDEGVVGWSGHQRLRMMNPAGSGSSACRSQPVAPAVREAVQTMLDAIQWRGLFMVELLRDAQGRLWFMELNGRPWGSMALARRQGLEYPAWAVALAMDPAFRPEVGVPASDGEPLICRHLGRELVHLLMVMRGPSSAALTGWPSRWQTVRTVLRLSRSHDWYNWRRGEGRLFFVDTWQTVFNQLRKRVARS